MSRTRVDFSLRVFADAAANLESVPLRRAQIAQHGGRLMLHDELEPAFAGIGFEHAPAVAGETLRKQARG